MLGIAGDNVVGLGSIGAFVDAIVGPVARNLESFGRMHHPANSTNVDEHGFSLVGLKFQAWTIEDFLVLRKHGRRNAQGKLSLQGKRQDHGFVSFGSDRRGDDDVGIQNHGDHLAGCFVLRARSRRTAAISALICRMVSLSVPRRWEAVQIFFNHSGASSRVCLMNC